MNDIKNDILKPDPLRVDASYEVFKIITSIALKAIKVDIPFLALPIVSQLVDFVFYFVNRSLFYHAAKFLTFEIIDHQVSGELSHVQESFKRLKKVSENSNGESIDEINKAKKQFEDDFKKLVSYRSH